MGAGYVLGFANADENTIRTAMLRRVFVPLLTCALCASPAFAQPKGGPEAQEKGETPPKDEAKQEPTKKKAAAKAPLDVKIPEVKDPMLKPVPAARRNLRSWQEALRIVRAKNPRLQQAAAQVDIAAARSRQALSGALPRLTGNAQITRQLLKGEGINFVGGVLRQNATIPDPDTTWNASLTLTQPVLAPQAWYDTKTARRGERAAKLSVKDTERIVLAAVAESIVSTITTERLAEIQRVNLKSALSTLSLNRKRAQLGAASAVDVLRAEQEVTLLRAAIVNADEAVRQSREALGLAMGDTKDYGVSPSIKLDGLARDARRTCHPDKNINNRPDVLAARANLEVARRNVSSVDYSYLPTVNAQSSLTYWEPVTGVNNEHVTWTIGAVLSWNLYDGGLRYGTRADAQGQVKTAQAALRETKQRAQIEVVQSQRAVRVARAQLTVSRKSRDLARETARLARVAFVYGNGTSLELIDAARRLQEAEIDVAIKEFELVRAQVATLLAQATCNI